VAERPPVLREADVLAVARADRRGGIEFDLLRQGAVVADDVDRLSMVVLRAHVFIEIDSELEVVRAAQPVLRRHAVDLEDLDPRGLPRLAREVVTLFDRRRDRHLAGTLPEDRGPETADRHSGREQSPGDL